MTNKTKSTAEGCASTPTPLALTFPCHRSACAHKSQVAGGYCPCCFNRIMTERYPRPEVVVLCGSTRFKDEFAQQNMRLTREGKIVLTVGDLETSSGAPAHRFEHGGTGCCAICDDLPGQGEHAQVNYQIDPELKQRLDDLHKRKIDMADEVLVLNVGGYVGESTRSEIEYAEWYEKKITYLDRDDTTAEVSS